jgi:hypothetical protein
VKRSQLPLTCPTGDCCGADAEEVSDFARSEQIIGAIRVGRGHGRVQSSFYSHLRGQRIDRRHRPHDRGAAAKTRRQMSRPLAIFTACPCARSAVDGPPAVASDCRGIRLPQRLARTPAESGKTTGALIWGEQPSRSGVPPSTTPDRGFGRSGCRYRVGDHRDGTHRIARRVGL